MRCYGRGCDLCNQSGKFYLDSCSRKIITPDVWQMLTWVRRYVDSGLTPVSGGGLDQTQAYLDSLDFMTADMRHYE